MSPQSRKRKKAVRLPAPSPPRSRGLSRLKKLEPKYLAWMEGEGRRRDSTAADWDVLVAFAEWYVECASLPAPDAFDPEVVAVLAARLDDTVADRVATSFAAFLDFLEVTGRWTRKRGARFLLLEAVAREGQPEEIAPDVEPEDTGLFFDFRAPRLSASDAWAAWSSTPLIRRTRGLLSWLGEGRDTTLAGGIRDEDVEAVALALEVPALEASALDSMWDHRRLRHHWLALVMSGLLSVGGRRAVPSPLAAHLDGEDVALAGFAAGLVARSYLAAALGREPIGQSTADQARMAALLALLIASGALPSSPRTETPTRDSVASPREAGGRTDEDTRAVCSLARADLAELTDAGLLEWDGQLVTPPVAAGLVGDAAAQLILPQLVGLPEYS